MHIKYKFYFKKQKQVLNYGLLWYTFIFQEVYVKINFHLLVILFKCS